MARSAIKDLTVGSPFKLILNFSVPLLFGFVFQQMYSFIDTAIVGRYLGAGSLHKQRVFYNKQDVLVEKMEYNISNYPNKGETTC